MSAATHTMTTAMALTDFYMNDNQPVMLWGPPGVGKTEGLEALSTKRGAHMIEFMLNVRESVDLRGLPKDDGDFTKWLKPAELPFEGSAFPDNTVLFLDEINTSHPSVMAASMQLVLKRQIDQHKLMPGVRIVAAGNRQSDRASANKMPTALANRFAHITVTADVESWAAWAEAKGIHPAFIAFIRWRPQLLHIMPGQSIADAEGMKGFVMASDAAAFPTPRSISAAAKYASAPKEVRQHLIEGLVGETWAAEFEGFIRTWLDLPSIQTILADPKGAKVPKGPGALNALCAAIARKATPANFATFAEYLKRVSKPYEVRAVFEEQKLNKDVCETPAFIDWCGNNQGILA